MEERNENADTPYPCARYRMPLGLRLSGDDTHSFCAPPALPRDQKRKEQAGKHEQHANPQDKRIYTIVLESLGLVTEKYEPEKQQPTSYKLNWMSTCPTAGDSRLAKLRPRRGMNATKITYQVSYQAKVG
jgi:hypothetical protein